MPAVLSAQFLELSFRLPLNEVAVLSMDEPFQGFIFVSLLRELAPTGAGAQQLRCVSQTGPRRAFLPDPFLTTGTSQLFHTAPHTSTPSGTANRGHSHS